MGRLLQGAAYLANRAAGGTGYAGSAPSGGSSSGGSSSASSYSYQNKPQVLTSKDPNADVGAVAKIGGRTYQKTRSSSGTVYWKTVPTGTQPTAGVSAPSGGGSASDYKFNFGNDLAKSISQGGASYDIQKAQENLTPAQIKALSSAGGSNLNFDLAAATIPGSNLKPLSYETAPESLQELAKALQEFEGIEGTSTSPEQLGSLQWRDINGKIRTLNLDSALQAVGSETAIRMHHVQGGFLERAFPPDVGKNPRGDYAFQGGINYNAFVDPEEAKAKIARFMQRASPIAAAVNSVPLDVWRRNYTEARQVTQQNVANAMSTSAYKEQYNYNKNLYNTEVSTANKEAERFEEAVELMTKFNPEYGGLTQIEAIQKEQVYTQSNKPSDPKEGDIYLEKDGRYKQWTGKYWKIIGTTSKPPPEITGEDSVRDVAPYGRDAQGNAFRNMTEAWNYARLEAEKAGLPKPNYNEWARNLLPKVEPTAAPPQPSGMEQDAKRMRYTEFVKLYPEISMKEYNAMGGSESKVTMTVEEVRQADAAALSFTVFNAKYPDAGYKYWKEYHTTITKPDGEVVETPGEPPDYEGSSPDPDFDEYLTFDAYLESLPDKGASLMTQWEALADEQIGDDYVKLKEKLQEQFDLFKKGQGVELEIAEETKTREERYLKEDLDRYKEYASEDRTKARAGTDLSFAKALSSAATGYMDRGINLSPMTFAGGAGIESRGLQHKAAAELRESVVPVREKIESAYTRGVEEAEQSYERGLEGLAAGYSAFKKRQGQALEETQLKKTSAETEYDIDRERLKAGLVATRKAEERAKYTSDQLRKFY